MVAAARGKRQERARPVALPESVWIGLLIGAFALYYVAPGLPLSLLTLALCAVLCYLQLPPATSLVVALDRRSSNDAVPVQSTWYQASLGSR